MPLARITVTLYGVSMHANSRETSRVSNASTARPLTVRQFQNFPTFWPRGNADRRRMNLAYNFSPTPCLSIVGRAHSGSFKAQ
jgi:hypothetical protein